jgi:hypothetical protein
MNLFHQRGLPPFLGALERLGTFAKVETLWSRVRTGHGGAEMYKEGPNRMPS